MMHIYLKMIELSSTYKFVHALNFLIQKRKRRGCVEIYLTSDFQSVKNKVCLFLLSLIPLKSYINALELEWAY